MVVFSAEEFDRIYTEVTSFKTYNTLLECTVKALKGQVAKWCYGEKVLRGGKYEDDVLQEICIKLVKNCIRGFFNKKEGGNYDREGFGKWVQTLAKNVFRDFAKKIRRIKFKETEWPEEGFGEPAYYESGFRVPGYDSENIRRLNRAFIVVMNSGNAPYKVLTWVVQLVIIAHLNVTKIKSNDIIVEHFSKMSLDDMFRYLMGQTHSIPWIAMDKEQIAEFRSRLDKKHRSGARMGDMKYGDFYMKKGPKASISDWVNRINEYVAKEENKYGTPVS